jgi:hypothetical protein
LRLAAMTTSSPRAKSRGEFVSRLCNKCYA